MKFHADQPLNNSIEAIGDDWVRIAGQEWRQSLLLSHDGQLTAWSASSIEALTTQTFADLNTSDIELVILGTGRKHRQIHPRQSHPLITRGVGLECMNSAAACRTFNVLVGEGRRVLLALILDKSAATFG